MQLTITQIRTLAEMQGLTLPEEDLESIEIRLATWLAAMAEIEAELGDLINAAEPIPPVYPREEF